ncbi:MAG TPA: fibronectin type III domain-containing protein, partial [Dyadobacter sp.]|nr:fibronectin type III domain-containing protein [Dyadobacter sp.]
MKLVFSTLAYLFIGFSAMFAGVAVGQQNTNPYIPAAQPDRIILNVTVDPSTSMAVNWRTSSDVTESFAEIAVASADPRFTDKVTRLKAKSETLKWEDTTPA